MRHWPAMENRHDLKTSSHAEGLRLGLAAVWPPMRFHTTSRVGRAMRAFKIRNHVCQPLCLNPTRLAFTLPISDQNWICFWAGDWLIDHCIAQKIK